MRRVQLTAGDWSCPALLATGFLDRLLGNERAPGSVVVLRTRSVHSLGQREPIELIGIDRDMKVVARRTLGPNRISVVPTAMLIIELPSGAQLPALGERVVMTDG